MTKKSKRDSTSKPKPRRRQPRLPGTEDGAIAALETAAEIYVGIRDRRMELTAEEVPAKGDVLREMHACGKKFYKRGLLEIRVIDQDEDVKVKMLKPKPDAD